jgi:hypothetical protein
MEKGFDCDTALNHTMTANFVSDGYKFVCRYMVASGSKRLTKLEAETISEAGLSIISVYETTADRSRGGAENGREDGQLARQAALSVGQTKGSAIYFAVDYDAGAADFAMIEAYLRAAGKEIPEFALGVYGSYAVVEEMNRRNACSKFWQTYAWSRGLKSSVASLYQYLNDTMIHGIDVDLDECYGNEGGWSTMDEIMKQLEELAGKVTALEQTIKALEKTPAPDWFVTEFGTDALKGIVNDPTGDYDFWRNTAVILRIFKAKGL